MTPEITPANYEEYLILRLDGELTPEEDTALDAFLVQHPELQATVAAYAGTRLTPDESLVFADKDSLLRPEEAPAATPRRMRLLPWSLAAAAVLLVAISLWQWGTPDALPQPARQVASGPQQRPSAQPQPETAPAPTQPSAPAVAHQALKPSRKPASALRQNDAPPVLSVAPPTAPEQVAVARLDTHPAAALPTAAPVLPEAPVAVAIVPEAFQTPNKTIVSLPVTRDRLQGLASLGEAAKTNLQRVNALRKSLRNTEATVALAGRELFTVRF